MGGGGGGPPDPEKWRGPVSKKMFLGHWASVWAKNKWGGGGGGGAPFLDTPLIKILLYVDAVR